MRFFLSFKFAEAWFLFIFQSIYHYFLLYFQARADVAEAKALLDQAKRSKVQSEMSVLLRRLETQLANLLDKQTNSSDQTAPPPTATAKQNGGQAGKPAYDVPYKNYCKW